MKKNNLLGVFLFTTMLCFGMSTYAEETTAEKLETSANKTTDNVKSTYRKAKDKTCKMVNGEMKCFKNKIKNKFKNLKDKSDTEATEIKNKID